MDIKSQREYFRLDVLAKIRLMRRGTEFTAYDIIAELKSKPKDTRCIGNVLKEAKEYKMCNNISTKREPSHNHFVWVWKKL